MCAQRVTMVDMPKIRYLRYNLMHNYVIMDQESTNQQLLLEFWRLLPEMVVTTMCAQKVTMVYDAIY